MRSSCINWRANEPIVVIRKSQLAICDGDKAAAALLSLITYRHDANLAGSRKANVSAKCRAEYLGLLQFYTMEDLKDGLLNMFGKHSVTKASKLLIEKGFISEHQNPDPKRRADRTKFYSLDVGNVQAAISSLPEDHKLDHSPFSENGQALAKSEIGKCNKSEQENKEDSETIFRNQKMPQPFSEIGETICRNQHEHLPKSATLTEITTEITTENIKPLSLSTSELDRSQDFKTSRGGGERENNNSTEEIDLVNKYPADGGIIKPLSGKLFSPPGWLNRERWHEWKTARERKHGRLDPAQEHRECSRLWHLMRQGWAQTEMLEDCAARSSIRIHPPCKPGDEKRSLAQRKVNRTPVAASPEGLCGRELTGKERELMQELAWLDRTIAHESSRKRDTTKLNEQRDRTHARLFSVRREIHKIPEQRN